MDSIYPLRAGKRSYQERSDDSELEEIEFVEKKNRSVNGQRKDQESVNEYDSDSFEDDDSDLELNEKKAEEQGNDVHQASAQLPQLGDSGDAFDTENSNFTEDGHEVLHEVDGVPIEVFNVDEEKLHGSFDINGNYTRANNDDDDRPQDQDKWIEDVKDYDKVVASQKRNQEMLRQRQLELLQKGRHYMIDEALVRLLYFVNSSENVLTMLARLNKLRRNGDPQTYIGNAINFVSDLIDILEHKGIGDVYSLTRADLEKLVQEESLGESAAIENYRTKLWSFKWIGKTEVSHGLYTNYQMQYWKATYFHHKVIVKFCHEPDEPANWIHIDCLEFM